MLQVHHRLQQEDTAGEYAVQHHLGDLRGGSPHVHGIRLAGGSVLFPAALLRFFGLFRYGDWGGHDAGLPMSGKFPLSLYDGIRVPVLEEMAHHAGSVVPGLCIYTAGRLPGKKAQPLLSEPSRGVGADWIMAWGQLELPVLGAGIFPGDLVREGDGMAGKVQVKGGKVSVPRRGAAVHQLSVGHLPGRGAAGRSAVYQEHAALCG